ncbi:hypothetical protein [Hydrogenimonas sp. SS33]|uniref:hypothetical protein n=1 Tax=Hydrogenimonas leucolamina TaxID=2954236 RepID=UPI00336C0ED3
MSWIERFKIALVEEDEESLSTLISRMPEFTEHGQMRAAQALITQAIDLFESKRIRVYKEMQRLECAKKFLTSSSESEEGTNRLDITS